MTRGSEEFGNHSGLGWLPAQVIRLKPADNNLRVPHVGWNDLFRTGDSILFEGLEDEALFYYVHTYYIQSDNGNIVVGQCGYGGRFPAVLECENIYATQFHPEKSQRHGLTLLGNFLECG